MRVGASVGWVFGWGAMRLGAGTDKRGRKEQVSLGRKKGRASGSRVTDLRSSGVMSLSTLDALGGVGVLEGMSKGGRRGVCCRGGEGVGSRSAGSRSQSFFENFTPFSPILTHAERPHFAATTGRKKSGVINGSHKEEDTFPFFRTSSPLLAPPAGRPVLVARRSDRTGEGRSALLHRAAKSNEKTIEVSAFPAGKE